MTRRFLTREELKRAVGLLIVASSSNWYWSKSLEVGSSLRCVRDALADPGKLRRLIRHAQALWRKVRSSGPMSIEEFELSVILAGLRGVESATLDTLLDSIERCTLHPRSWLPCIPQRLREERADAARERSMSGAPTPRRSRRRQAPKPRRSRAPGRRR
jgi:hypothetical protein